MPLGVGLRIYIHTPFPVHTLCFMLYVKDVKLTVLVAVLDSHSQATFSFFGFPFPARQGFFVVLKPILELVLIDQTGLELTEIQLP